MVVLWSEVLVYDETENFEWSGWMLFVRWKGMKKETLLERNGWEFYRNPLLLHSPHDSCCGIVRESLSVNLETSFQLGPHNTADLVGSQLSIATPTACKQALPIRACFGGHSVFGTRLSFHKVGQICDDGLHGHSKYRLLERCWAVCLT